MRRCFILLAIAICVAVMLEIGEGHALKKAGKAHKKSEPMLAKPEDEPAEEGVSNEEESAGEEESVEEESREGDVESGEGEEEAEKEKAPKPHVGKEFQKFLKSLNEKEGLHHNLGDESDPLAEFIAMQCHIHFYGDDGEHKHGQGHAHRHEHEKGHKHEHERCVIV